MNARSIGEEKAKSQGVKFRRESSLWDVGLLGRTGKDVRKEGTISGERAVDVYFCTLKLPGFKT